MNGGKAFVDTNIFLYLYTSADKVKRDRARSLIRELQNGSQVTISTQVVQEFYVNARRLQMAQSDLMLAIAALFALPLVIVDQKEILMAIALEERYGINFWDALILAAAESSESGVLYTEDLNHGQRYGRVTVRNPFAK
jgi:predicted nucleic acid-binding protein